MKKLLKLSALSLLLLTGAHAKEFRYFSNPDKTKSFQAAVINVVIKEGKKFAILENLDNKRLTVPLESFCTEDQAYLTEQEIALNLRRNLLCTITENKSDPEKTVTADGAGERKLTKYDVAFNIKLRNQSPNPADGLKIQYQVFWKKAIRKDNNSAERVEKLEVGEKEVSLLPSRTDALLDTPTVTLLLDKAGKGKVAAAASAC